MFNRFFYKIKKIKNLYYTVDFSDSSSDMYSILHGLIMISSISFLFFFLKNFTGSSSSILVSMPFLRGTVLTHISESNPDSLQPSCIINYN